MKKNDLIENIFQSIKDGDTKAFLENDVDYQIEKLYYTHNKERELKSRKDRERESIIVILLLIVYYFYSYGIILILILILILRIWWKMNELSWYKKWFMDGCKKAIENQK